MIIIKLSLKNAVKEFLNATFQETGANGVWNASLCFDEIMSTEEIDSVFTSENVSEMKLTTDTYTRILTGYKVVNVVINYTDTSTPIRIMLRKQNE